LIVCEPAVVSVAVQLAVPLVRVAEHSAPCVDDVNVTVPVGFVPFTTEAGSTVDVSTSVAPLATE
jgi:hypothetical protein